MVIKTISHNIFSFLLILPLIYEFIPFSCSILLVSQVQLFSISFTIYLSLLFSIRCHCQLLVVWLLFPVLPYLIITLGYSGKDEIYVGSIFSWDFIKSNLFALCIIKTFLLGDYSVFFHIDFISYNHSYYVGFIVVLCIN